MTTVATLESKPYHHGDLRRALLTAAETVLERDGPTALSLRAVAREAGVSPAAPYHHFKDKRELLNAIAREGFSRIRSAMAGAIGEAGAREKGSSMGAAYVEFAQTNPALYRVMFDCARNGVDLREDDGEQGGAYGFVRDTLASVTAGELGALDLELTTIASLCAAHGLAEMSKFERFKHVRDHLGGERAFIQAVLDHVSVMSRPRTPDLPHQ